MVDPRSDSPHCEECTSLGTLSLLKLSQRMKRRSARGEFHGRCYLFPFDLKYSVLTSTLLPIQSKLQKLYKRRNYRKLPRMHRDGSFKSTSPLGKAGRAYQTNESMMIVGAPLVYWLYLAWIQYLVWKVTWNRVMGCLLLWQRFDFCPMRIWTNSLYIVIVHTLANPCCLFLKFSQTAIKQLQNDYQATC